MKVRFNSQSEIGVDLRDEDELYEEETKKKDNRDYADDDSA